MQRDFSANKHLLSERIEVLCQIRKLRKLIAETFLEVADALETGQYGKQPVIGFASEGSEHGEDNIDRAMELAVARRASKLYLIEGEDIHKDMEEMLDSGEIDAAVTMHYPFPVGVSTVGKVITPGMRKGHVSGHDHRHFRYGPCLRHGKECHLRHHCGQG